MGVDDNGRLNVAPEWPERISEWMGTLGTVGQKAIRFADTGVVEQKGGVV